jgi:hypothetical protein
MKLFLIRQAVPEYVIELRLDVPIAAATVLNTAFASSAAGGVEVVAVVLVLSFEQAENISIGAIAKIMALRNTETSNRFFALKPKVWPKSEMPAIVVPDEATGRQRWRWLMARKQPRHIPMDARSGAA